MSFADTGNRPAARPNRNLHLVYFALAAFDIVTITMTLFLSDHIMNAYEEAVRTSRVWAARATEMVELAELAQQTNAPGNDVFDSLDVEAERSRRDAALAQFNEQYAAITADLSANAPPADRAVIMPAFVEVRAAMELMTQSEDQTFSYFSTGRPELAGRHMASMDRTYAALTDAIARALSEVQSIQLRHLESQIRMAEQLRRLELAVIGLIFLIIIAVAFYGHKISQVLRRNEEERTEILKSLEAAHISLQHYADNVAHELRSPVNKMLLGAEVALARSRSADEYADALAANMEDCQRLSSIIEGLLFLARAGSSQLDLQRAELNVGHELGLIQTFFEASAAEQQIELGVSCPEYLYFPLDPVLFQRAIVNLVSNALSHTPAHGRVLMTAWTERHRLIVEVADTGEGIDPTAQAHLFERFYRADPEPKNGRLGLGLPIAKSIVDLHGGRIDVESALGRGTRIRLAFAAPPAPPGIQPARAAIRQAATT